MSPPHALAAPSPRPSLVSATDRTSAPAGTIEPTGLGQTADRRDSVSPVLYPPPLATARTISVIAAPHSPTLRPLHLLDTVNFTESSDLVAGAASPPTSSASVPNTTRARRRDSGDGSVQVGHRSTPLTETELMVRTPRAAVAGIAGGIFAGAGGAFVGRGSNPTR